MTSGNVLFDAMLHAAPADDPYLFYISGGLEPLTNPGLGALVRAGAARGFKLSLYTNGFMLTPHLLSKQPGLWELDTLRISLYGPDRISSCARHAARQGLRTGAPQRGGVSASAQRAAAPRRSLASTSCVLHGHADQVLEIVELIAEVNREANGGRAAARSTS